MAEQVEGGGPPVNHGEKLVLEALVAQLAEDVRVIPNWTVVHADRLDECDAIVVTRDAVFIVETKFLVGEVEIGENDFWVDGSKRTHPYHLTHHKAQRLRTKLNDVLPWFGSQGRVEAQVVLAVQPHVLEIDDLMLDRVIGIPAIGETLNSPSFRVFPQQVGRLAGRIDEVVAAITGVGTARERDTHHVDGYRIDEVIFEDPVTGYFRAIGTNRLAGVQHVLEVFSPLPGISAGDRKQWYSKTAAPYRYAAKIGAHGSLLSPTGLDHHDDGSVVLVWPMLGESAIKVRLDGDQPITADQARTVVRDIASALAHVHVAGYSHRAVDPIHCAIRPDGRGILRFGEKVVPDAVGQAGDLESLGLLIGFLAGRTGDEDLSALAQELSAGGALDATGVVERLSVGVIEVAPEVTLDDVFTDLEPLTKVGDVTVYSGTDSGGSRVAVKVIGGADSSDPATWREYRMLRDLNHPSIVRTYGSGVAAEGPFMTMELLGGSSLSDLEPDFDLDDTEKVTIAAQLLSALAAMHPDPARVSGFLGLDEESGAPEPRSTGADGVVHNDICPDNVRWIPGRGAVLFDFDLAGRLDSYMGELAKPYRPADVPVDVAAPDADIYAVGALLHELLTGMLPYEFDDEDRRIVRIDEKLDPALREVLETACAATNSNRFATAEEFLEALIACGIDVGDVANGDDKLERMRRIEELIRAGEFEEAFAECDESWTRLRARIENLMTVQQGGADLLLTVDGVELRRGVTDTVENQNAASTRTHPIATAHHYQAVFPNGGYLDFAFLDAEDDEGPDYWMAALHEVETHPRIKRLVRGLRPGTIIVSNDPLEVALRLKVAALKPENGPDWSTAVRASAEDLAAMAGFDVGAAILAAGGLGYGTHEEVFGDTTRNRADLCVLFDPSTEAGRDAAAIAYFASRVMALWHTIV